MRSESDKESLIAFPSSCINSLRRSSKISPFLRSHAARRNLHFLDAPNPRSVPLYSSVFSRPTTRLDCSGPTNAPQVLYRLKRTTALILPARYSPYAFRFHLLQDGRPSPLLP